MARLNKQGLDYFPLDVDFFLDDKIRFVVAKYGYAAEAVIIRLLCRIYREGYFTFWNNDIAILFAQGLGDCDAKLADEIVHELVKRDFFERRLFKTYSLLTSKAIQRIFCEASARRKNVNKIDEYWLLDKEKKQSVQLNGINVNINSQKKVKEKESETENESEKKKPHGEFGNVLLSEKEIDTLKTQHTQETIYKYIELIDQFVQRKGDPYKDYYATVKSWIRYDSEKEEKEKCRAGACSRHPQNARKPNGFTDYAKRTWDYDELSKKEQEYIDKELAKSNVGGQ